MNPGRRGHTTVQVTAVDPGGFGDRYGIKMGDIIIEVNGKPVGGLSSYRRAVRKAQTIRGGSV